MVCFSYIVLYHFLCPEQGPSLLQEDSIIIDTEEARIAAIITPILLLALLFGTVAAYHWYQKYVHVSLSCLIIFFFGCYL